MNASANVSFAAKGVSTPKGKFVTTKNDVYFPFTRTKIDISTTRATDGSIQRSECSLAMITSMFDYATELLVKHLDVKDNCRYKLRLSTPKSPELIETPVDGTGKLLFEKEKVVSMLKNDDIKQLMSRLNSGFNDFSTLFHDYFLNVQKKITLSSTGNQELSELLRRVNRTRVRYLEDLCHLYLAMGGQKYFDFVAYTTSIGAYTLESIFSFMELCYGKSPSSSGADLLKDASRKVVGDGKSAIRGEIHLRNGLIISFSTQLRLMTRSRSALDGLNVSFVPIELEEDPALDISFNFKDKSDDDVLSAVGLSLSSDHSDNEDDSDDDDEAEQDDVRAIFERKSNRYILDFDGYAMQDDVVSALTKLIPDQVVEKIKALDSRDPSSLKFFLDLFSHSKISIAFQDIRQHLVESRFNVVIKRLNDICGFNIKKGTTGVGFYNLLTLLDDNLDTEDDTMYERLKTNENFKETISAVIDIYKGLF